MVHACLWSRLRAERTRCSDLEEISNEHSLDLYASCPVLFECRCDPRSIERERIARGSASPRRWFSDRLGNRRSTPSHSRKPTSDSIPILKGLHRPPAPSQSIDRAGSGKCCEFDNATIEDTIEVVALTFLPLIVNASRESLVGGRI